MKQNFVILRKTPTKTRYRKIARFLFGIFLSGAPFAARLLMCAACAFPARALPRKSGHRRLQCFYMKRLFGRTAALQPTARQEPPYSTTCKSVAATV